MALASPVGVGFAVLAAASLAVQSLAVRLGTRSHSVSAVVAVMFAVNLLVLVPLTAALAFPAADVPLRALAAFAAAGVLGSLVARICYFVGIARLGASRTEPLKALFPLVAVATAVALLGERVTPGVVAGVALLVGGGVAVTAEARSSPVTATGGRFWLDLAFPLAAALLLGVDPVLTKLGLAAGTTALVGVTVRIAAAAGGFALYLAWRAVTGRFEPVGVDRWLLAAAVANTAYLLSYYAALARTSVAVVTPLLGLSTLFVVGGAALFLPDEERVTWRLAAAATLVAAGVVLVVTG